MRHEYIDIKEDHYRAEIKVFPIYHCTFSLIKMRNIPKKCSKEKVIQSFCSPTRLTEHDNLAMET